MSADADAFIQRLLELGAKLKKAKDPEDGFDGEDFDTITTNDPFVIDARKVQMFRDSEHYFCVSISLKNGNMLHVSAPISKFSMNTKTEKGWE